MDNCNDGSTLDCVHWTVEVDLLGPFTKTTSWRHRDEEISFFEDYFIRANQNNKFKVK